MNLASEIEKGHDSYNENKSTKLGFQLGAAAELEVFSFLYVGTTISFYQTGRKTKDDFGKATTTLNNIKIPIDIGYKLPIGNVSVFGSIGPYASITMFGKYVFSPNEDNEFQEEGYDYDVEFDDESSWLAYKRIDSGLSIAAGVDYKQFQAHLNYSFGLRDITPDSDTMFSTAYKTTSSVFNLSFAYFIGR
jgi:hypothetical protein